MDINKINDLDVSEVKNLFGKCCGSKSWVQRMIYSRPFKSKENLLNSAEEIWNSLDKNDWLEAFTHHPKIGDINSIKEKFSSRKNIAATEQSGVRNASNDTLKKLSELNYEYEKKFGFIFIVCATGKTADEMLEIVSVRIQNHFDKEIINAMNEQNKITKLRLEKLL